MRLSIVTPSFRNSDWLKLCVASVADQQGVEFEHIVQDSCSDDGTQDWLPGDPRVKAFVEKDAGMYDAVNRGFRRATGDILAYLNCDEQYLPGALKAVHDFFEQHPDVDVVFSDTVIVDPNGRYICHRKTLLPNKYDRWVRMRTVTCSMFLRRRILDEKGLFFDTRWLDLGDYFWVMSLIDNGIKLGTLRYFTSSFTETGENMNLKPNARTESEQRGKMVPLWIKSLYYPFVFLYWIRAIVSGVYLQKSFSYELYTKASPASRVRFDVTKPVVFWKGRL